MIRIGESRICIDRAVIAAGAFLIEGWLLGPGLDAAAPPVISRRGPCASLVFRYDRFDVNDAFQLPRFHPNAHLGFRIFGRVPPPADAADPVLGLVLGTGDASPLPVALSPGAASDVADALLQSIRHQVPASDADLDNAALLLTQIRSQGLRQQPALDFPPRQDETLDVLILARRRPDIAEMNATLIQQVLGCSTRILVVATDWTAARGIGSGMVAAPRDLGVSLQYIATRETLPSSLVVGKFLASERAPQALIVMDDVFIAPCLPALSAALGQGRSFAVPRASRLGAAPAPQATASGFLPLGVLFLDSAFGTVREPRLYEGRGFALEQIFLDNRDRFLVSDSFCLDLLPDDQAQDSDFVNRLLLA